MRKKEIEANLGMNTEENLFSIASSGKKEKLIKERISVNENVTVSVFVQQGKRRSVSRLTVKQSDIDSLRKKYGALQFCLI